MVPSLPIGLIALLSISSEVLGTSQWGTSSAGQFMPLTRRVQPLRSASEWPNYAKNLRDATIRKYSLQHNQKRGMGENLMVNEWSDTSFYGTLAIGTPPLPFDVLLDTGSSDLWVASSTCQSTCAGTGNFDTTKSSTFKNLSREFNVTYGGGDAAGTLGQDVVLMAGFAIANQEFGNVNNLISVQLSVPTLTHNSGGDIYIVELLAKSYHWIVWSCVAITGILWCCAILAGACKQWPMESTFDGLSINPFYKRQPSWSAGTWRILHDGCGSNLHTSRRRCLTTSPGYANESLYTGTIDYRDIPNGQASYWLQQITSITVQGTPISLPPGNASYAAIDTGTTLIAGPSASIAAIYAQIPGSQPGTGDWNGFYSYPCNTAITVEISFGGPSWLVSSDDFEFTSAGATSDECYGAFYAIPTSPGAPPWIIGDTFLKNVYSVFRYNPPSVGFAALSEVALAMNGKTGGIPYATLGANSATYTAESNAAPSTRSFSAVKLVISALIGTLAMQVRLCTALYQWISASLYT